MDLICGYSSAAPFSEFEPYQGNFCSITFVSLWENYKKLKWEPLVRWDWLSILTWTFHKASNGHRSTSKWPCWSPKFPLYRVHSTEDNGRNFVLKWHSQKEPSRSKHANWMYLISCWHVHIGHYWHYGVFCMCGCQCCFVLEPPLCIAAVARHIHTIRPSMG